MRYLTNSATYVQAQSLVNQKELRSSTTGGAIRFKKHKNSYNYASVSPIELKIVMQYLCPICHKCI